MQQQLKQAKDSKRMRYWLDTEFIEDGVTIDLISIGIVAEDGREFYAISDEFDESKASDWVKDNVLSQLPPREIESLGEAITHPWMSREEMKNRILGFIGWDVIACNAPDWKKPEFWGYYADYDWVVFCWLFGTMMQLPSGFPMYCRDLKQWCDTLGNPKLPEQGKGEHNALADARWNKQAWEFLSEYEKKAAWTLNI